MMDHLQHVRLLVCGGRDYQDRETVYRVLDDIHKRKHIALLIHGAARGADSLGRDWALLHNVPTKAFPANWGKYGKSAGYRRNLQMITEGHPNAVVAFPGGKGTAHMRSEAAKAGIPIWGINLIPAATLEDL